MKNIRMLDKLIFTGLFFQLLIGKSASVQTIQSAEIVIAAFSGIEIGGTGHQHLTPHLLEISRNGHSLPDDIKDRLIAIGFNFSGKLVNRTILEEPRPESADLDKFYDIGNFRIHYTLDGTHAVDNTDFDGNNVPDYVDIMVETFTHVYNIEINQMGYSRPPGDGWLPAEFDNGGSNNYDIYIRKLSSTYYGYVQSEYWAQNTGDNEFSEIHEINAFTSYMAMRNDYSGFYSSNRPWGPTTETEAIQVTASHEFFHAIQYGYDGQETPWLLEATATWMEEAVYDDINDCYQYMPSWFSSPQTSLNATGSHWYGSYIFFEYIYEHLGGSATIRRILEEGVETDSEQGDFSFQAIDSGLVKIGSSFKDALNNMVIANLVMSSSPGPGAEMYSYEEAEDYPITGPAIYSTISYKGVDTTITSANLQKYAGQYIEVIPETPILTSLLNTAGPQNDLILHAITIDIAGNYVIHHNSPINIDPTKLNSIYFAVVSQEALGTDWNYQITIVDGIYDNLKADFIADTTLGVTPLTVRFTSLSTPGPGFFTSWIWDFGDSTFSTEQHPSHIYSNEGRYTVSLTVKNDLGDQDMKIIANYITTIDNNPDDFSVSKNYPNPFNKETQLSLTIKIPQNINMFIIGSDGRFITDLTDKYYDFGAYVITWDGKNYKGYRVASGVYFIATQGAQLLLWQKVTLLK